MPRIARNPGPIYCWVCGGTIESASDEPKNRAPPTFVSEKRRWKTAWVKHRTRRIADRGPFAVSESESALDTYFKNEYTWNDFFRLIVVRKNEDYLPSEYQVSGIAWLPGVKMDGKYLLVPRNRSRACLGAPEWDSKFLAVCPVFHPFAERTQESNRLDGYAVHSRCWTLLEREVGDAPIEIIILALRKEWRRIMEMLSSQRHDEKYAVIAAFDDDEFFRAYQCWPLGFEFTWLPDPIYVREVRTVIRKSINSLKRKCTNPDTRGPVNYLSAKYDIPLEILYLISECLALPMSRIC
ncbi:hypothetical protein PHISP_04360 [Aspergillus sp. HF37]|nr:hypothetical protein PHISP_04360 [Aspergillus sp. HF37]